MTPRGDSRTVGVVVSALLGVSIFVQFAESAPAYRFPEAELLNADFETQEWGSGELTGRSDLVGDSWPVAATAGLAWDGGYLPNDPEGPHAQPHHNVDISGWGRIAMRVTYQARGGEIRMRLFMNTGMTGPSGYPSNEWRNDAAWLSPVVTGRAGEPTMLVLDFDDAEVWNAHDNPWPHSGHGEDWTNGTRHAINERDRREITNIGFEAYGTANKTVDLDIDLPVAPPALTLAEREAGGEMKLAFTAEDANDHRIQSSSNLVDWSEFTVFNCVTGTVTFTDSDTTATRKYYRAVAAP